METDYQVEALRMLRDPRTMHRRWLLRELSKVCYPLITQFNFVRQLPPDDAWFTFSISFWRCANVALICVAT